MDARAGAGARPRARKVGPEARPAEARGPDGGPDGGDRLARRVQRFVRVAAGADRDEPPLRLQLPAVQLDAAEEPDRERVPRQVARRGDPGRARRARLGHDVDRGRDRARPAEAGGKVLGPRTPRPRRAAAKGAHPRLREGRAGVRCTVPSFFEGSRFWRIKQLEIRDVRLVYAPPRGIGNYGGEVDNWMWPRHTGDFGFLRAYVAAGRPAGGLREGERPVPAEARPEVLDGGRRPGRSHDDDRVSGEDVSVRARRGGPRGAGVRPPDVDPLSQGAHPDPRGGGEGPQGRRHPERGAPAGTPELPEEVRGDPRGVRPREPDREAEGRGGRDRGARRERSGGEEATRAVARRDRAVEREALDHARSRRGPRVDLQRLADAHAGKHRLAPGGRAVEVRHRAGDRFPGARLETPEGGGLARATHDRAGERSRRPALVPPRSVEAPEGAADRGRGRRARVHRKERSGRRRRRRFSTASTPARRSTRPRRASRCSTRRGRSWRRGTTPS